MYCFVVIYIIALFVCKEELRITIAILIVKLEFLLLRLMLLYLKDTCFYFTVRKDREISSVFVK